MEPLLLILFVGEDRAIAANLEDVLKGSFRMVRMHINEAIRYIEANSPAAILIDLPDKLDDGVESCRRLRASLRDQSVPIIVLAGGGHPEARAALFEAGADDLMERPVHAGELSKRILARISRLRSLIERHGGASVITAGRLRMDLDRMEVQIDGGKVPLGPVEFKILSVLVRSLGRLRSREEIEAFVWGENRPASRALDPHINALRKKIQGSDLELRTVYGAGYSLRLAETATKVV